MVKLFNEANIKLMEICTYNYIMHPCDCTNTDVHTLCIMCAVCMYAYVCVCVCVCVFCTVTFIKFHSITYSTFSIHSFSCLKASGHLFNHLRTINPSTLNCLNNMVPLSLAPIYTLL